MLPTLFGSKSARYNTGAAENDVQIHSHEIKYYKIWLDTYSIFNSAHNYAHLNSYITYIYLYLYIKR